jgi:drug/metabolite transporter (DMT)-like permease
MTKPLATLRRWLDAGSNPVTASLVAAGSVFFVSYLVWGGILSQTDSDPRWNVALPIALGLALLAGIAMFLYARRRPG